MKFSILNRQAGTLAKVSLEAKEAITAEAGAMVAMSGDTTVTTSTHKKSGGGGGMLKAVKRMISGESFFVNHFTAGDKGGDVYLAPNLAGDITSLDLSKGEMIVQGGSFLASETGINMDMSWQGAKNFFSGEGLFWLSLSGNGQALINTFGAVYTIDVKGEHTVDTGHIVAFPKDMEFSVGKAASGWVSSLISGEGLVCKFKGEGRVYCQSHNTVGFGQALGPMLKPRES